MRVYEFAKQYNVSSKELINKLAKKGFEVSSHMSMLGEKELKFLQDEMNQSIQNGGHMSQVQNTNPQKSIKNKKTTNSQDFFSAEESESVSKKEKDTTDKDVVHSVAKESPLKIDHQEDKKTELFSAEKKELVLKPITLNDLADAFDKPMNELILCLLKMGIPVTKNQIVPEHAVVKLAEQYGVALVKPSLAEDSDTVVRRALLGVDQARKDERLPVVVVIGHVDHGKTTLLDYIRKTRVAAREKGGITQHIGAYEAATPHGNVIFVDTPGHEAFGKMRQRGITVADIAILVVAADDGVMPQTVEAIRQAKLGKIPVVVAINKVDKADALAVDRVKQQIAQYGLLPEEWGGDVVCVPISAKTGEGIDLLLEMIVLQSQLMDLRTRKDIPGQGFVLEARFEKGRGGVATIICHDGAVSVGDYFVCGNTVGHVTSLVDSYGKQVKKVGASVPVRVSGFEVLPEAGDTFSVVSKEQYRKQRATPKQIVSANEPFKRQGLRENSFNIILKTDTHSSLEALLDTIHKKFQQQEIGVNVVSSGVGDVNESDVVTALNTESEIISFHVKAEQNALALAQKGVVIHNFDIIYRLLEFIEEKLKSKEVVVATFKKTGEAVVLKVFDIKGIGVIAGAQVKDGVFHRKAKVVVWRQSKKIGEGFIDSLQREKKNVKEVLSGFECAFMVPSITDWAVGDRVECYVEE